MSCGQITLKELNIGVIYLNPIFLSPTSHKYNTSDYMLIDPMYGTIDDFKELINKAKELGIYIILDGVFNHTGDDSIYFNKYHHFESIGAWESKSSIFHKWYDFNDRHVSEIKEEDIKNTIVTKNAYVLFYRRQTD